jgi:hypothetical protein
MDVSSYGPADDAVKVKLFQHRERKPIRRPPPPPKTTLAALFMFLGGVIFLFAGTYVYFENNYSGSDRGLGMLLVGTLSKSVTRFSNRTLSDHPIT